MSTSVALVTGGGKGIGKAISQRLAKDQPVLMVGRDASALEAVQREILATGGEAQYVSGDLTEGSTLDAVAQRLGELDWRVSSLVLNAAQWEHGPIATFSGVLFRQMLAVNVTANFDLIQRLLPQLLEGAPGTVVFNVGVIGLEAYGNDAAYVASKHALMGLAKSMAREYGNKLRIVPFCTAYVEGDRTNATLQAVADKRGKTLEEQRASTAAKVPAKRIISLEEFSEAVAQSCLPETSVVSGAPVTFAV